MTKKTTTDALDIMQERFGDSAEDRAAVEQYMLDMAVGSQIHALRTQAGLTQTELAKLVGTTQSIISDLEDAEYEGHTLRMLRRIADALHMKVQVSFIPSENASPMAHA